MNFEIALDSFEQVKRHVKEIASRTPRFMIAIAAQAQGEEPMLVFSFATNNLSRMLRIAQEDVTAIGGEYINEEVMLRVEQYAFHQEVWYIGTLRLATLSLGLHREDVCVIIRTLIHRDDEFLAKCGIVPL